MPYRAKTAKFCSFACNLKDKQNRFGEKRKEAARKATKGNKFRLGHTAWNKGKTGFIAWNKGQKGLQIAWNKGIKGSIKSWSKGKKVPQLGGKNHWNWKGGITSENRLFRNSGPYRKWRSDVFRRDGWKCILCGYRSKKPRDIRADHIKPFSKYPLLRIDVSNGRTLCVPCDLIHGWQLFRENNPRVLKINSSNKIV